MSAPPTGTLADHFSERWAPSCWAVLLIGLALWITTIAVGGLTSNPLMLPTIVLLGSFLVPLARLAGISITTPARLSRPGA